MNKTKRLLALVICLLMTITSLPVFADGEIGTEATNGFVSYQETTFKSVDELTWSPLNASPYFFDYATASVDENGFYTLTQTATTGTETKQAFAFRDLKQNLVAKDDANRTEVVADAFNGRFIIDLDMDVYIKKYPETTNWGYVSVEFVSDSTDVLITRFRNNYIDVMDNNTNSKCLYVRNTNGMADCVYDAATAPQSVSMKYEIDTVNGKVSSWYNGVLLTHNNAVLKSEDEMVDINAKKPINRLRIFQTSRIDNGSYMKFKNFKITQVEDAAKDIVESLPATLVANVNGATETSVTLPSIDGVTWASATADTATVSGNTLTLIPSEEGTKEAVVTAKFKHSNVNYVKTYKITLAKVETPVVPEPEEPSIEGKVVLHEATFKDASDVEWTSSSTTSFFDYITPTVDENGYYVLKQTASSGATSNQLVASRNIGTVVLDKDDAKRTDIKTSAIDGKYIFELDLEAFVKKHASANGGYYAIRFMSDKKVVMETRVWADRLEIYDVSDATKAIYKRTTGNLGTFAADKEPHAFKLKCVLDTVNKTASMYYNGALLTHSVNTLMSEEEDCPITNGGPIDKIVVFGLSRIDEGSYLKFKDFKVTEISSAASTTISALPETLVENVNGATETSVTLPTVNGVTWASATAETATVSGSTLTFIPSTEGTKEATVTATFKVNNKDYVKTYNMTLAKAETPVIPDPEPDPDPTPDPEPSVNGIVSFNKVFNYANVDAAMADGWSSNAENHSKFVIEDGAVKLEQFEQTVADPSNSTKANSGFGTTLTFDLPAGVVSEDSENQTKIINEDGKYTGIVKLDIDGAYSFTPAENTKYPGITNTVSTSYAHILISGNKEAVQWRVRPVSVVPLSNTNEGQNNTYHTNIYVPGTSTYSVKLNPANGVLLGAEIDMAEQTVTATIADKILKGDTWAKNNNKPSAVTYISKFTIHQMQRLDVGSYSKLKSVKLTTIDPKFGTETSAVLAQLPAKLVGDINGATELSVSLPAIDGVTWTSLTPDAATVSGNTLSIIPSKTATKEAIVKATFTTDGIKYSKEYTFTVAVNDSLAVEYYVEGTLYKTVNVNKNDKTSSIDAPVKAGMIFEGWYLDGAETAFDFSTAITADTKLYAKYSVDPDYNPTADGVVAFSKVFNYSDVDAALADGWSVADELNSEFIIKNGAPTLNQYKQTMTEDNKKATATFGTKMTYQLPAGPVAVDLENRTSVINLDGKYTGKIKVDVDGILDLGPDAAYKYTHTYIEKDAEGKEVEKTSSFNVNVSYATMILSGDKNAVNWRIRPTYAQAMSHTNEDDTDIKDEKGAKALGGVPKNGLIMSTLVDTVDETIEANVPYTGAGNVAKGSTWAKYSNRSDLSYVNNIYLQQMIRLPVGSFSTIRGITVTTLDPKFGTKTTEMLGKLPAKLDVDDINAVTTAEFTLPAVDGVEWTSSDDSLLSIDGNKVTVNRVKGEAKEVTVTATFTADNINFAKEYAMTLAAGENIVKYYDVDGNLYDVKEVKDGEKATDISAPVVEHYNFIGWYEADAEAAFNFNTSINNHVTLYAKYEAKTYNVIFKSEGNTVATLTGKYGSVVDGTIPAIPPVAGKTTIGWYVGNTEVPFGEATLISGPDMVINAKYAEGTLNSYKVTFKVDGTVYAEADAYEGYAVTFPESPVKDNYTFAYWTLDGNKFSEGTPVTSKMTLEAKFDPNPVKVNFYMDETMTELYKEGTGYYNTAFGTVPVPTKDLHKFIGWKFADGTDFTKDTVVTEEISVYATWEYTVKVILDEDITTYDSMLGKNVQFSSIINNSLTTYFDGGFVTEFIKSNPTDRAFSNFMVGSIRSPEPDYADEANRRMLYNSKFVGDYEIEIIFDAKLSGKYVTEDGTSVNAPYGYYSTGNVGTTFNALLVNRIYNNKIDAYNAKSASDNSFNDLDKNKKASSTSYQFKNITNGVVNDNSIKIRYNTVEATAYMTVNDAENVSWGTPLAKLGYVNGFQFQLMGCNQVGDYVKIKRVRVIKYNDYSESSDFARVQAIFDQLPKSLVEDPYNATGTITLPAIKGVTWSSSDESIVSSETGEINPWYNDVDVEITATISSGMYSYEMVYTLTVKGSVSENKEIINETFTSEEDLDNWEFVNLDDVAIGEYSVDENGVTVSKITSMEDADKEYETKRYFAFYDLYSETTSDDYSVTEVKDHEGVYDVTVDYSKFVSSKLPANIAVGYRNGNVFYDFGMLKINKDGTKFSYQETGETKASVALAVTDSAKLTFRIDNIRKEICVFENGKMIAGRYSFKTIMGDDARINSVKVELDTNNEMGDFVTVRNISAATVVANESAELNKVLSAANTFDVYDITSSPASVSGNINNLPKTLGGYDVVWTASNNQIDLETGEVFHAPTANKVYLYASIYDADAAYPYVVRKTFELNVRAAANSTEADKYIINNLGKITNQPYDDIRYDLTIPQVDGIVWTSSNADIISNDGVLNANKVITSATPVTITATSNGVTRDYKLVVSPRTAPEAVATGTSSFNIALDGIENAKVSGDVIANFTYTKGATGSVSIIDNAGRALVSLVSDADGFHFDYIGSNYEKYNLETAEISIIAMSDVDKAAIFVNGDMVADYVPFKFKTDYIMGVTSDINVGTITLSMDKYDILQSNLDNFDYFGDAKYEYANKDGINLPVVTLTDAVVTWTSSNTSVLTNNGAVTTPNSMNIVPLEFKIKDAQNNNVFISKTFNVAVDCDNSKNIIYKKVAEVEFRDPAYKQDYLTDGKVNTVFKALDTNVGDVEIVFNLGEAKVFNSCYVLLGTDNMEGFKVYASNDGSSWNLLTSDNMNGKYSKLVKFESTTASYIKFVVEKTTATEVDMKELKMFISGSAAELAQYDLASLSIETTPTGSSINLPSKGVNGTAFTWESSDEKVISNDGKITRPSNGTTVKLTAKAVVDGQEFTKTFDVYVDSKSTNGPSQVGGGSGGGGGGGAGGMSSGATSTPVIGEKEETVYTETEKEETPEAVVPSTTSKYNDVKATDWYADAVNTLTEKGIVSGDGTGYFYPTNNVTREQFVKMILEAIEVEVSTGDVSFADVTSGAWYEAYIATAVTNGIVNGIGGGNFGVGTNITRQDMAVLIERVLNFKNIEVEKAEVEPFADAANVADYAQNAVANMKAIGLIKGYDNNYNPKDNLTRAEAATVISSLLELLAK